MRILPKVIQEFCGALLVTAAFAFTSLHSRNVMEGQLSLIVKWNGSEYELEGLSEADNVETLKNVIFKKTGVRPERQKLLNLKFNGKKFERNVD